MNRVSTLFARELLAIGAVVGYLFEMIRANDWLVFLGDSLHSFGNVGDRIIEGIAILLPQSLVVFFRFFELLQSKFELISSVLKRRF